MPDAAPLTPADASSLPEPVAFEPPAADADPSGPASPGGSGTEAPEATDLEALGDRIARLSAHLQAATYRLLAMIADFDEAEGWHEAGFRSCAAWLSWRTGIGPGAAREKVRVARALAELPVLSAAMGRGELSYSVARAITRVATPENEAELVEAARHTTAAGMERLVRAWRTADRSEAAELAEEKVRHDSRELTLVPEADGSWRLRGRLDPEAGAVLRQALEAAAEALYRKEDEAEDERASEDVPAAARRADAMGLVAEAALGEGLGAGSEAPEAEEEADEGKDGASPAPVVGRAGRFEVVVHVAAETLAEGGDVPAETSVDENVPAETPAGVDHVPAETSVGTHPAAMAELEATPRIQGGPALARATARRLACDAGRVGMVHGPGGSVLDVGRRTRSVPAALRRALDHRDAGCVFPGCGARFCDAHHLLPWAEGGETSLENLVLLCRRHHRLVHEDGWTIERVAERADTGEGRTAGEGPGATSVPTFRFIRPDGRPLPRVPGRPEAPERPVRALQRQQRALAIDPWTATPHWAGERLDADWALFALRRPAALEQRPGVGPDRMEEATDVPAETLRGGGTGPGDVPAETSLDDTGDTETGVESGDVPAETSLDATDSGGGEAEDAGDDGGPWRPAGL